MESGSRDGRSDRRRTRGRIQYLCSVAGVRLLSVRLDRPGCGSDLERMERTESHDQGGLDFLAEYGLLDRVGYERLKGVGCCAAGKIGG